jgi:16S rRNA (adenine1518-N6/adenine1519-N6)-dimethyltransferase
MRQRLGQHFLRDPKVIHTILAAAELSKEDTALEIGPGKGILTIPLLERVARLVAVELDDTLAARLEERFKGHSHAQIVHADILKVDLDVLADDPGRPKTGARPIKILGNLPYSITSPIFEKLMVWPGWDTGVFLIQREVAERITAKPGSRDFGILSLAVQLFAEAETIIQVKPGAFLPPPRVSSSVIRLRRKHKLLVEQADIPSFFDLVHGAFAHRRKTVANSLAFHSQVRRQEVEKWLAKHAISAQLRAECIPLEDYAHLSRPWSVFRRETKLTSQTPTSTIRRV